VSDPRGEYGWRARIGMLKPSPVIDNNAHEFYLMAPPGVELFVCSMGLQRMAQSEYERVVAGMEEPLRLLLRHEPHVILQAGVPPIVTRGWGFEDELLARVTRVTSVPFFTDVGASIAALRKLGCGRIVMVSFGFDDELTGRIREYLGHAGIELVAAERVQSAPDEDAARVPLGRVYDSARDLYRYAQADGIWITHASMPSVAIIDDLERDLGVPVVSSAQALMWTGLRAASIAGPIEGFGELLRR